MENRYVAARRTALWQIIQSEGSDEEKLDALFARSEQERRAAYGRGWWDARRASALQAGKLRRTGGGKA